MTNRNTLLGRSRPSERLSKRDRESLERTAEDPVATPRTAKAVKADTPIAINTGKDREGPVEVSLDHGVPGLRFHGKRQRQSSARTTAGQVRSLQAGAVPGLKVTTPQPTSFTFH